MVQVELRITTFKELGRGEQNKSPNMAAWYGENRDGGTRQTEGRDV